MQIYLIKNKINQKCYVGQTIWDFQTRYRGGHWDKFTHNKHLKMSAAKYGVDNFEVKILENGTFTTDELITLEDKYIKEYNCLAPNGYNFKEAGKKGRNYYNHKEYELKDRYGNIYNIINLSQFCKKNNLNYGAMLNMVSGINLSSAGYALSSTPIESIVDPNEEWELEKISTKEIFKVKRKEAADFCKKIGIKRCAFFNLVGKKIYISGDFKLKETVIDGIKIKAKKTKYENIQLIDKDGKEIVVNNVYQFCKINNISRQGIYSLVKGDALEAYGFKLKSTIDVRAARTERLGLKIKLKNIKTNEILDIKNISEFCRKNGFNINVMHNMIIGNIKQYMNYTLPERDLSNYKFPKRISYIKLVSENGEELEGKSVSDLLSKRPIMSKPSVHDIIKGKYKSLKGWKVKNVKYFNNYYPEITL